MSNQDKFIELAVSGGYKGDIEWLKKLPEYAKCQIWIDPKAWAAVGKVEGWKQGHFETKEIIVKSKNEGWFINMHRMIDALCEGKTIEDYLGEILA